MSEVHAHRERDGRVEVGHGDGLVGDVLGDVVGLAVDVAAFDAGSGEPPGEDAGMMTASGSCFVDLRRATELGDHHH